MDPAVNTVVSKKFNSTIDSDVTFKSSDGVLFHVHRKNLEVCTGGFPPAEISTKDEIVDLTETSATLELLFQFMYPRRHPSLDTTPFEVLEPLAEAAEKYQVFPAMNICHIRMRDMVNDHPVAVAVYAAKHDYPYLVSEVAPMMLSMPPVDVISMLPPYLVLPWTRYVQEWTDILQTIALADVSSAVGSHLNGQNCNRVWPVFALGCMQRLGAGVHTLRSLDKVFDISTERAMLGVPNDCCTNALKEWRERIEAGIAQIPKFNIFLSY
ncbi:hypothetical protein DFH07DRAFT_957985 [Mycena maculata]|uniref:BTB domain-containing protein n=1 Tax=Mycena maculata TaxID=230809 RepID=A0AAD7NG48_9AGAR|nr:hypothetical protein DFH07DRAFT_957985 [Mycena maculata]